MNRPLTVLAVGAFPSAVFALVNAGAGLTPALVAAVAAAAALAVWRARRREPIGPALGGLVGVAISAFFAWHTGAARDFFASDIALSATGAAVTLLSVLARYPLVGVVWSLATRRPITWRHDRPSMRAYDLATLAVAAMFAGRLAVQTWLYGQDLVGWLAVAKVALGFPLSAVVLLVAVRAVRRSDRRLSFCS